MKTVEYKLGDQCWYLCLNGSALISLYERFGTEKPLLQHVQGVDRKAFEAICAYLSILGTQGELVRRYEGYDHGKFPAEYKFRTILAPLDLARARAAITEAVKLGFELEHPPEEETGEIDLGLEAIRKKEGSGFPGAAIYKRLLKHLI